MQNSYSLLPNDEQQSRLSQDFGKLAASVQDTMQQFVDEQGRIIPSQAYEFIFERLFASFANADDKDEVGRQLTLPASHSSTQTATKGIDEEAISSNILRHEHFSNEN